MESKPLVVVGAGAAGTGAAIEAAKAGVKVTLIDENPIDMSMMGLDVPQFFGQRLMPTLRNKAVMLERVVAANPGLAEAEEAGVDIQLGTYVWGAFRNIETSRVLDGPQLGLADQDKSWVIKYDHLILATGARDIGMAFPGWNMAGAMGANGAHSLLTRYQALTSQRIVILGSGELGLATARMALDRGMNVAAVVEVAPAVLGDPAVRRAIEARGVKFYTSHTVKEATSTTDDIESVTLVKVDRDHKPVAGSETKIDCDTVILALGLAPSIELAALLDCQIKFDRALGGYAPVVDEWMRTSVDNVFVAGDVAGLRRGMVADPEAARRQGRLAAVAAAESLGAIGSATALSRKAELSGAIPPAGKDQVESVWKPWLKSLINVGGLDVFACQCEEVTRRDLLDVRPPRYLNWKSDQMSARSLQTLLRDGPVVPDQVKRLTRAAMGHCQGRRCREQVLLLVAEEAKTDVAQVPMMTFRPPVRPLPLRVMWADDESQEMRDEWVVWFKHSRDYLKAMLAEEEEEQKNRA